MPTIQGTRSTSLVVRRYFKGSTVEENLGKKPNQLISPSGNRTHTRAQLWTRRHTLPPELSLWLLLHVSDAASYRLLLSTRCVKRSFPRGHAHDPGYEIHILGRQKILQGLHRSKFQQHVNILAKLLIIVSRYLCELALKDGEAVRIKSLRKKHCANMLGLQVLVVLAVAAAVLAEDIVTLKQGRLRGHVLKSRKGRPIYAFQGIPFAKPPVGDLRFKAPQPAEPWEGVLDATKEAAICVQRGLTPLDLTVRGDEDCLYLNVYTPKRPTGEASDPLDVMFWIHGGGWYMGSGNTDFYGPQYLLDKDVMLVTTNYRLGSLGFLSTEDEACPGNNGLKDQVAALRWVRDNIAAFGGNPDSVTIFGESAGGASVHYQVLSPASRGLFHRAISQSGIAICPWALSPRGHPRYIAEEVAAMFDCPTESSSELIACLREKDAYELYSSELKIKDGNRLLLTFQPVVEPESEEAFITEEPFKILQSGTEELVPWMVGVTSGEASYFVKFFSGGDPTKFKIDEFQVIKEIVDNPQDSAKHKLAIKKLKEFYYKDVSSPKESVAASVKLLSDFMFNIRTDIALKLHSKRGAKVYFYYFDHLGSNSFNSIFGDPDIYHGVAHLDDVIYLFPQDFSFPNSKKNDSDERVVDLMVTLWTNFARRGDPTPTWKAVSSPDVIEHARLDAEGLHMGQGLHKERIELWDSLPFNYKYPHSVEKDEL